MHLFDFFQKKKPKYESASEPIRQDISIQESPSSSCRKPEETVPDSKELERWAHWRERLPRYFEKYHRIELEFLKETLEIEPDGYGGTDRLYYYDTENRTYYTAASHWDGGNMFANRSGSPTALSKEQLVQAMEKRKERILNVLSPEEAVEFETVFNDIMTILLHQVDA